MKGTYENRAAQRVKSKLSKQHTEPEESIKALRKDEADKPVAKPKKTVKTTEKVQTKKKAGRPPKTEKTTVISLAIPERLFPDIEAASLLAHKGNRTSYIVSLIEKDIKANGQTYQRFKELSGKGA